MCDKFVGARRHSAQLGDAARRTKCNANANPEELHEEPTADHQEKQLKRSVRQAASELSRVYCKADDIFLIAFLDCDLLV
jgi:hypothetical protein